MAKPCCCSSSCSSKCQLKTKHWTDTAQKSKSCRSREAPGHDGAVPSPTLQQVCSHPPPFSAATSSCVLSFSSHSLPFHFFYLAVSWLLSRLPQRQGFYRISHTTADADTLKPRQELFQHVLLASDASLISCPTWTWSSQTGFQISNKCP